ncbi:ATP-binding protein [Paramagnetospirillum caucaseum]|uniref:ATP-binding protein n=1 Tax=Paramagnetospirillum caucaseum TaxID=1244869 RepID=UPI001267C858|nr:ATP-binding protein [Paramagnetospirillum caucaseum]
MAPPPVHTPLLQDLRCDPKGITALGSFFAAVEKMESSKIQVDCHLVSWIDANMAAALGAIVAALEAKKNVVTFVGLKKSILDILSRNGFITPQLPDKYGTVIPFNKFSLESGKLFAKYIEENLRGKGIPKMSPQLRMGFLQGLNEIFNNCSLHSQSKLGVFCCGQAYPKTNCVDFSVVDLGIGFRTNVNRHLSSQMSASEAIDWAMTDENTTRKGDVPGGLGLKILREFVALNKGSLTISSDGGFWRLSDEGIVRQELPTRFTGSVVNLRINTADKSSYRLKSEVDPNSVL